jgi:oxygen-dependent protoporphyrinogen oxidase
VSGSRVVVIGGGISGLAAAWRLSRAVPGAEVIVLEGAATVGGKLRLEDVGGLSVDVGAESVLARRPEAVGLIQEIGLGSDLVHPKAGSASVLSRGVLHPLPAGTVMGVPARSTSLAGLAGLLSPDEVARVAQEPTIPVSARTEDVDVASWVAERMGRAVVDRLVEPLLGGVYAGHADRLSLQATVPALWQRAVSGQNLLAGPVQTAQTAQASQTAQHQQQQQLPAAGPVFAGIRGGVGRLALTLADRLRENSVQVRTSTTVRGLRRTETGWQVETGPAPSPSYVQADAVILAVPPAAAAKLLAVEVPAAAAELAQIEAASVAVVVAAVPREQLHGVTGTGLLIPPIEDRMIKAATFSSGKWSWVSDDVGSDLLIVRLSVGRAGEERVLQRPDGELTGTAVGELAALLGRAVHPVDTRVVRWGGGLPQYNVGHLDRIRRLRAAVAAEPALAICGAALDGVGVPACIAAADQAVADLTTGALGRAGTIVG